MRSKATKAVVAGCVARGLTDREAAAEVGIYERNFRAARKRHGIPAGRANRPTMRSAAELARHRERCRANLSKGPAAFAVKARANAADYGLPPMPKRCVEVLTWLAALGPMTAVKLAETVGAREPWGYGSFSVRAEDGSYANYLTKLEREAWLWRAKAKGGSAYHLTGKALAALSGN